MSYVVLARRYRPQKFSEVIGQEHVAGTLSRALNQGRIAHAYLFGGPRGVGKTTIARILAKSVNCATGDTAEPCGVCESCVQITEGRNMDVLEIDAASNRGVDDVRSLRDSIRYAPSVGRRRVVIVDEVHMFTKEAFNAFLKTLEEPPEHAVFILATTDVHQVPPTVLSRCQRFEFRRLDAAEVATHLTNLATREGLALDAGAAAILARRSDGSLRDGLSLLDQMIAYCGGRVTETDVVEALGLIRSDRFFEVTRMIREQDTSSTFAFIAALMDTGADLSDFVRGLLEHLLVMLRVSVLRSADGLALTPEERTRFETEAPLFDEADLVRMLKIVADAELTLRGSYNPRLRIEMLLQRLVRLDRTIEIAKLVEAVENAGAGSHLSSEKKSSSTSGVTAAVAARAASSASAPPRITQANPPKSPRIASVGTLTDRLGAVIAQYPALEELVNRLDLVPYADNNLTSQ